jgi:hypothetical protein
MLVVRAVAEAAATAAQGSKHSTQREWRRMAHDSKGETRRRVPHSAATIFAPDRRRRIDAVIDYFGESGQKDSPADGITAPRRTGDSEIFWNPAE